jgi:glycerol-3-phosphate responsive antiterminator
MRDWEVEVIRRNQSGRVINSEKGIIARESDVIGILPGIYPEFRRRLYAHAPHPDLKSELCHHD